MQNWKKLGLVFVPDGSTKKMLSYASVPFVTDIISNKAKIFFSSRDQNEISSIFSLELDLDSYKISNVSSSAVLESGELGAFDDSGVMGCGVLKDNDDFKLYYIGWNLGVTVPFRNSIGLAVSKDNLTYNRAFTGPILDRTRSEPFFCGSNCVIKENGIYKIWYLSCTGWFLNEERKPVHRYHIKYAESLDGIDWKRNGYIAIDYIDDYEYAISVPRVIKECSVYKMWFSSRATENINSYRIRYAESLDGVRWVRKDNEINLTVSDSGWDSEMICYPFVFDYKGKRYMLYNGNDYGKTGFGLAVLEE